MYKLEYLWLSHFVNIKFNDYQILLKIFKNVKNIYYTSKNKNKLLSILRKNNIKLEYKLFIKIVNEELKIMSEQLLNKLVQKKIKIITYESNYFPENLKRNQNPPLLLFAYGDISSLYNKKILIYNSNSFSSYGKFAYNDFASYLNSNNISIVSDILTEKVNIYFSNYLKCINRKSLLVISNNIKEKSILNYEYICGISDYLFFPEAEYNLKPALFTDIFLEEGKEIFVLPGNIYSTSSYFSNFLIKNGANVITSKKDLLNSIS